jgi:Spy/CpxP family protein refolding chaperone
MSIKREENMNFFRAIFGVFFLISVCGGLSLAQQTTELTMSWTKQQDQSAYDILKDIKARQKQLVDTLKEKRQALNQELDKDSPDRVTAEALADEMGKIQGKLETLKVEQEFSLRSVFLEKYSAWKAARQAQRDAAKNKKK